LWWRNSARRGEMTGSFFSRLKPTFSIDEIIKEDENIGIHVHEISMAFEELKSTIRRIQRYK
jgi:hypothetical protein